MTENSAAPPVKYDWPLKCVVSFSILSALGFIPWESVFSVELRSDVFPRLIIGIMGLGGLFCLLCTLLIWLLRRNRWYSGLAILVIPVLLMFVAFVFFVVLFSPPGYWQDEFVYRNGNDYLIVQGIEYEDSYEQRVIRTASPFSKVRHIEKLQLLSAGETNFGADKVVYNGKTWYKQKKGK